MNADRARELVEMTLLDIVPDADLTDLPADADLRESLELDSLDFVTLVERLSVRAQYRIDEEDYPQLRTMDSAVRFLASHAA